MTPGPAVALPETCCATLWLGPGHAIYAGPSLELEPHSGSVTCLAIGVDGPFTVRTAESAGRVARSALIPPRVRHQLVASGRHMVFCYLDATSEREKACRQCMTSAGGQSYHDHVDTGRLAELGAELIASGSREVALRWLRVAAPSAPAGLDPRIARAARFLREHPDPAPTAEELAVRCGVSVSRFLHLFRAHTGTSFRRYRLWARMLRTAGLLSAEGGHVSLTTAAVAAGFASPSHFSDSFHAMFGSRPSRVLTGTRIAFLSTTDGPG
ncbi:DNA-binding protein [Prauserella marina]|uniref:AraC-type DNA-binding protein n=1 Tax=Prauserella marina TaxID=530584 RepID=A0A222VLG8_9PSEU|nr:AraC family transcriptional regulator [Prauserella marina]ASR34780.1 DNA-binding protein [Prauserella marina]PWV85538.1 AraC family transcriptional regulator [Prauserella marina]SDC52465.1 AraC-type DNA-binding protein [Prauserella marina]